MDAFTSKLDTSSKEKKIPKFQGVSDDKSAQKRVVNGLTHICINYIALPGSLEGAI